MAKKKAESIQDILDRIQEDIDNLMEGIIQLVTTGEILHDAVRVDDLPEDEQQEIMDMLERKEKRTRH